ncbi:MAG: ferrochelatase [Cytophagales bacterium]|nr:ferrochelatase [Cytophagales bacterium]
MKGILLVNLGTPDSTSVKDVRKYLREFLMDKRVIDIFALGRWMLVNLIISPFRAPKSAKEYEKLFDDRGSPLKYYGASIAEKLQTRLGNEFKVALGMRYQSPSLVDALDQLKDCESIHVIPLFPQYASATTGSVHDKVMELVKTWQVIPELTFTSKFFEQELYLETIEGQAKKLMKEDKYDHFVFSYHGIPERQVIKSSVDNHCEFGKCCEEYGENNQYCYRAQCFESSRLIAERLEIKDDQYTITFQSRLGKTPWIRPYTDDVLKTLPAKGIKKVLAFSPAFVSDCLETTVEVGELFRDLFLDAGGEKWTLVPSLNEEDKWVECLAEIVIPT